MYIITTRAILIILVDIIAKRDIFLNLSHNLRNPFQIFLGFFNFTIRYFMRIKFHFRLIIIRK